MTYVRVKKFKRKNGNILEYLYSVESKRNRVRKKVRQKFKGYLGRVYRLSKVNEKKFLETVDSEPDIYLKMATKEKIIHDLIRFELIRHGFTLIGNKWIKDNLSVDLKKNKIINGKKSDCVLAMNEGYIYNKRMRELYKYDHIDDTKQSGLELARLFIESGIDVPQDVFIGYYEKL